MIETFMNFIIILFIIAFEVMVAVSVIYIVFLTINVFLPNGGDNHEPSNGAFNDFMNCLFFVNLINVFLDSLNDDD